MECMRAAPHCSHSYSFNVVNKDIFIRFVCCSSFLRAPYQTPHNCHCHAHLSSLVLYSDGYIMDMVL
ncbi:hypothetical protein V5799_027828 [Amblyomma americanum]|uniref:Uncharacterized protein n=1 Tax=Amblyomma americanum TaxID=6943 RepID=A0AAQ4DEL7_AMBAM